ncbi:MAG TPA: serine/threonine-protein kinase [Steroidobacteraceae bacterium]|jgi:eukaryotic-like serine/threonine-protein kinase|nr:serine/threonine-protein kinase [Steroidobacteraceae bacterium]
MRKFGLIAAIVGLGILAAGLLLRLLGNPPSLTWLWMPGAGLLAAGSALFIWTRMGKRAPVVAMPNAKTAVGTDTARLLDNFEQRFAELKGRKPNANVLQDLYALGNQLEHRGRIPQAAAVYRHLARFDNTYRDVAARLHRLMEAERVKPKAATTATPVAQAAMGATTPDLRAAPKERPASAAVAAAVPDTERLGRYQLEREIGRGAMGVVYLGRDTAINRMVAIKAIPLAAEFSDAELVEARSRFFREAETAGRLNHPNIVTIYDVGEERGLAYIAMEYLKGRHLSDYAKSNNLLEPRKVLEIISRTADALGFAHKQQVVHRDIKPANLMYDPSTDVLKITDFGIARLSGAGSTRTGIVLGTPSFMSPEQLEGRTVTGHSDLFSLGVSLFQLLTGQLPFTADSMTGLMQQIAEAPHPPLRAFRPDLPACVESVIDQALAKNPEARYDSGAQMAAALEDCRSRIASGSP